MAYLSKKTETTIELQELCGILSLLTFYFPKSIFLTPGHQKVINVSICILLGMASITLNPL